MYLLYIDESQNSDKSNLDNPEVFGLSGLLITARYLTSFVDNINKLRDEFSVKENHEIRGYEIFNNRSWAGLSDEQRREFCKKLSEIIVSKNSLSKGFFCYKNSKLQKEDYLSCLDEMISKSTNFVSTHGGNTSKQLLIIFDQKDEFQNDINLLIQKKQREINKISTKKTCRIIDHGFPGKSHLSEMLQASDFSGYVLRLSKTLQRKDTLFTKKKDDRFISFVDELVSTLKRKIGILEIK